MKFSSVVFLLIANLFAENLWGQCMCSMPSANSNSGIFPQYLNHFVGLGYSQNGYLASSEEVNRFRFQQTNLITRISVHKKLQLLGMLPFNYNAVSGYHTAKEQGIGDAQLKLNYFIVNRKADCFKIKQFLTGGLALKLPTGKMATDVSKRSIQTGTGSTDYSFNLNYVARYKEAGIMLESQYNFTGIDKNEFKFGNSYSIDGKLFLWMQSGKHLQIIPSIYSNFRRIAMDVLRGYYSENTGGSTVFTGIGCDVYFKRMGLLGTYQSPVYHNLQATDVTPLSRFSVSFIYFLK